MKRKRHVFGRVRATCPDTGKDVRIELTREGLLVRPKYARRVQRLTLSELVTLAAGQGVFRL